MRAAGIPNDEIDRQLRGFADAVFGAVAASNGGSAA